MSKHTPGPWVIDEHHRITAADGGAVSAVGLSQPLGHVPPDHIGHANARLIAAAPEMLEKLRKVAGWLDRLATASDTRAKKTRFTGLADACKADAKNYRATRDSIMETVAKAEGRS